MDITILHGYISENGKLILRHGWQKKIANFKKGNLLKEFRVSYEIVDTVKNHQWKYIYGNKLVKGGFGLYHSICQAMGEADIDYVDWICKRRFLFESVNDFKEIPKKYVSNCQMIIEGDKIKGYVKAKRDLTQKEIRNYIQQCEQLLFVDLNGRIEGENIKDVHELRALAMGIDNETHEIFGSEERTTDFENCLKVNND